MTFILRSLKNIKGYSLKATDGEIGRITDFFFDNLDWAVRYAIVDTGNWLKHKEVMISMAAFEEPDWAEKHLPVVITKEQIKNSPRIDLKRPVSRKLEDHLATHYKWPVYWADTAAGGAVTSMREPIRSTGRQVPVMNEEGECQQCEDPYVRSINEVTGYSVNTEDDEFGEVTDFIVDDESWIIRYLVVDTGNWLPGKKVLVAPEWIEWINFFEDQVSVNMTKEEIKNSPEYDPTQPVNREHENTLYDYLGRPKYWL